MFLLTHRSARTWSFKPKLPGAFESPVLRKPDKHNIHIYFFLGKSFVIFEPLAIKRFDIKLRLPYIFPFKLEENVSFMIYLKMLDDYWRWQERYLCPTSIQVQRNNFDLRIGRKRQDGRIPTRASLRYRSPKVTAMEIIVQLATLFLPARSCVSKAHFGRVDIHTKTILHYILHSYRWTSGSFRGRIKDIIPVCRWNGNLREVEWTKNDIYIARLPITNLVLFLKIFHRTEIIA